MDFHPVGLQIEDRPGRLPAAAFLRLRRGLVGAAIGIDDEMNGRAVDLKKIETKPGVHEGEDLGPRVEPVHMGIGQFTRALQAVNRQAIHFHGEMAQAPAQRLQFHPAPGGVLEDVDDPLPDEVGKMRSGSIEEQAADDQNQ